MNITSNGNNYDKDRNREKHKNQVCNDNYPTSN